MAVLRHVLTFICVAFPLGAPAAGYEQMEPCAAESVLTELDLKNPQGIQRILREAGEIQNSQAMLWRVERDGLAPSHLFGTIHVVEQSVAELSTRTAEAIKSSKLVALEAAELPRRALQIAMVHAGKLMSARDRPLQRLLDEDELKVVERTLSDAGYPNELALGIRPWVATLFLTGSECQARSQHAGHKPLDLLVSDAAKAASIPVAGLETMLEQFEVLASIPDDVQAAWLKASIATHDRIDDITRTLAELYRFRRINAVWELTRELAPTAPLSDDMLAAIRRGLVDERNPRLLQRSLPYIEAGGAFIAVGALHLSGPNGLVELLRQRGYSVHAIE